MYKTQINYFKERKYAKLLCRWNLKINDLRGYLEVSIHDVFKMFFNGITDSNV